MSDIIGLLELLRKQNDANDYGGLLKQVIQPPAGLERIATLGKRLRDASPMIADRFRFAGEWVNAAGAQRWLTIQQIRAAGKERAIARLLSSRRKHWPASLMATSSPDDVSLFGVDELEGDETYLIWGDRPEPRVASYLGHDEQVFGDFREYLSYLTNR